jgi:hypothetical protein
VEIRIPVNPKEDLQPDLVLLIHVCFLDSSTHLLQSATLDPSQMVQLLMILLETEE